MTVNSGHFLGLKSLLALGLISLALAGCDGDDGPAGPAGASGNPGATAPPGGESPPESSGDIVLGDGSGLSAREVQLIGRIVADITSAAVNGTPVIEFTLKTQSGDAVLELDPGVISFTLAKLYSPGNGQAPQWQSYINRIQTPTPAGPQVLAQAVQATTESGRNGVLEELGEGAYRYTFATDLANVTSPLAVSYEPAEVHRVGFELRMQAPGNQVFPDNPVFDFIPATGAAVPLARTIAANENCSNCHERLEIHGGPRVTVEYCVTCHNPGSIDPDSGESVDMAYMTHAIHLGQERTEPYIVYGFGGTPHDYSDVTYPQSPLFCENCHAASAASPEGDNWKGAANTPACAGCHVDGLAKSGADPVTGQSLYVYEHDFGPAAEGTCVSCHAPGSTAGGNEENHLKGVKEATLIGRERFEYEVLAVASAVAGAQPVITFAVSNPANGTRYDIKADEAFNQDRSSLTVDIAWNTSDYSNEGSGSATVDTGAPAQPVSLGIDFLQENAVRNDDGSYTVTAPEPLPGAATGGIAVALEGHPVVPVPSTGALTRIPVKGAVLFAGEPRREIVSLDSCNACHESVSFHGDNRVDNIQLCAICHNPDATDVRRRDGAGFSWATPSPLDGKGEESVDMRFMIHALHARQNVVYGFGNRPQDYRDITYPQGVTNCDACHLDGTYYPSRAQSRSVTINTGADRSDWRDDVAITPVAAACWSCHQGAPDSIANLTRLHILQNGGYLPSATDTSVTKETLESQAVSSFIENCGVCHGPGKISDVEKAHGLR
ncbi:MAG: OmcA/MtrC family decaheme c-type cytochrome [Gammaproteobacteria bacterium]|jgi:OmcA/MtrC family decaheme c-type cytochrome